jgi:uncharacterized protein
LVAQQPEARNCGDLAQTRSNTEKQQPTVSENDTGAKLTLRTGSRSGFAAHLGVNMVKIIQMLAVSLILVCASGAARAGEYEDGLAAVHRGDYATALKLLIPLAQTGHAWAQYDLGVMYDHAEGVAPDDKEAVKWYRAAAAQGNAWAQSKLGNMYNQGHGVAQDYKEAVKWYRLAADQGFPPAQGNLGRMYGLGRGVAQDYVYAHMWLNLAAASLSGDELTEGRSVGDLISKRMTSEQISQAQVMARKCQASDFKNCD